MADFLMDLSKPNTEINHSHQLPHQVHSVVLKGLTCVKEAFIVTKYLGRKLAILRRFLVQNGHCGQSMSWCSRPPTFAILNVEHHGHPAP